MFVQIIEGTTSDAEGLRRQGERWRDELRPGATGFLGATEGVTDDGRAITIARFESEQAARANSERPEQDAWWSETAKYYDGEPTFTESTDVEEQLGGVRTDAGFVQVMKSAGLDRQRVAQLDEQFEQFAHLRPDLIGTFRVWTGPDRCLDVAYFTSEAEARAGEKSEMPEELQSAMAEFEDVMQGTEYLDLRHPQLF
jgi:hypothetical protein